MASIKTRVKRHALIKKSAWENQMPDFKKGMSFTTYGVYLTNAMGEVDPAVRQKYVIDYWKANKKDVTGFAKVSPYYFYSAAAIVFLKSKGIAIPEKYEIKLTDAYKDIQSRVKPEVVLEKKEKKKVSVQENISELAKTIASEIDGAIDDFCTTGNRMNIKKYLISAKVSAPVCKEIASFYGSLVEELKEAKAGKDEQLKEGYSHIPKRGMTNFIAYIEEIITEVTQMSAIAKAMRKPRKRKEKAPSVIASKVAYLGEDTKLKVKSVHPEKVVGATQVWVFNIKYRKIFKYEALDGMTLTWKGTTLQNFDPTKSGAKTIRKPEEFLAGALDTTKRRLERMFDEVKSVLAKATGRINNETLIVRVF